MGKAFNENVAAMCQLASLREAFGSHLELVHVYIMNMGGYYLDFEEDNRMAMRSAGNCGARSEIKGNAEEDRGNQGTSQALAKPAEIIEEAILPFESVAQLVSETITERTSSASTSEGENILSAERVTRSQVLRDMIPESEMEVRSGPDRVSPISVDSSNCTEMKNQQLCNDFENKFLYHSKDAPDITSSIQYSYRCNLERLKMKRWTLTAEQIIKAKSTRSMQQTSLFQHLPEVSAQDLERLSNGDTLVKFLAVLQISWLVVQLIGRKTNSLPVSQLEIATLAFAASSLITYLSLWDRPRAIERRIKIEAARLPTASDYDDLALWGPSYIFLWSLTLGERRTVDELELLPIPNNAVHEADFDRLKPSAADILARIFYYVSWADGNRMLYDYIVMIGCAFGGMLFGAIHCLAWDFPFPKTIESILWRVSSVLTTALPLLTLLYFKSARYVRYILKKFLWRYKEGAARNAFDILVIGLFITPYVLARMFLLVEIFRSLFYLPTEAFQDTWSGSFPHWG